MVYGALVAKQYTGCIGACVRKRQVLDNSPAG